MVKRGRMVWKKEMVWGRNSHSSNWPQGARIAVQSNEIDLHATDPISTPRTLYSSLSTSRSIHEHRTRRKPEHRWVSRNTQMSVDEASFYSYISGSCMEYLTCTWILENNKENQGTLDTTPALCKAELPKLYCSIN